MTALLRNRAEEAFQRVVDWSRQRDYAGYDKHDALMSPLVRTLTLGIKPLQFAAVQAVMRFPVNLRPFLGVRVDRNPKGIGLIIRALLDAADLDESYRNQARLLSEWLLAHRSPREDLWCWGYQFPWPSQYFRADAGSPNSIVTIFAAEGLLDAHRAFGDARYLDAARSAADWLGTLPLLVDDASRLCIGYTPSARERIINVNAVAAGFLARLARVVPEAEEKRRLLVRARRMLAYVDSVQTREGAWYYADPATASHIEHDNYHTGGILDGFMDYFDALGDSADADSPGENEFDETFRTGLRFYEKNLFEPDGFPRWERRSRFPGDVHGSAQGIITFTRAAALSRAAAQSSRCREYADQALSWALDRLYDPEGRFYHQVRRFGTRRTTLMRWCNAWMLRAIAAWRK